MRNKKIICIVGKAGTGKDTILKIACQLDNRLNPIISYTSRPQREGEIDGLDYYFITEQEFLNKIQNDEMLEYTSFNGWFYGIGKDCLSEKGINIGVFNPAGVETLEKFSNIQVYLFVIHSDDKVRLIRQLNREENPDVEEIVRRYWADQKDFRNYDLRDNVNNTPTDLAIIINKLEKIIDQILFEKAVDELLRTT